MHKSLSQRDRVENEYVLRNLLVTHIWITKWETTMFHTRYTKTTSSARCAMIQALLFLLIDEIWTPHASCLAFPIVQLGPTGIRHGQAGRCRWINSVILKDGRGTTEETANGGDAVLVAAASSNSHETIVPTGTPAWGTPICEYHSVPIPTSLPGPPRQAISVEDLTPTIRVLLRQCGMQQGMVNVISRHTTTAITINERESRLAQDLEDWLRKLAPPDERAAPTVAVAGVRYRHNDIDQRPDSMEEAQRCRENGWNIDDPEQLQAWRAQEPINAHSHLAAMLLGSSESIPVVNGEMVIGQVRWY